MALREMTSIEPLQPLVRIDYDWTRVFPQYCRSDTDLIAISTFIAGANLPYGYSALIRRPSGKTVDSSRDMRVHCLYFVRSYFLNRTVTRKTSTSTVNREADMELRSWLAGGMGKVEKGMRGFGGRLGHFLSLSSVLLTSFPSGCSSGPSGYTKRDLAEQITPAR